MGDHLNRGLANIDDDTWKAIDEAAVSAARTCLSARRFLDVEGPYGVGLTAIEVDEDGVTRAESAERASIVLGRVVPVPQLRTSFVLGVRRLAARGQGQPLDLRTVEDAAQRLAASEEDIVFRGEPQANLVGLLTATGRQELPGRAWDTVEAALEDVLAAVTKLGEAGFRGPYALALAPARYNSLFRVYENSNLVQLDHFKKICGRGVFKAPIEGGVVVDPQAGRIVVGQDLTAGYERSDGTHHHLYLTESLVLRIDEPRAICTLGMGGAAATTSGERPA